MNLYNQYHPTIRNYLKHSEKKKTDYICNLPLAKLVILVLKLSLTPQLIDSVGLKLFHDLFQYF